MAKKPAPLTVKRTDLWPITESDERVKLSIEFEGGGIELILNRMEAAKLVGDLRTHFGL